MLGFTSKFIWHFKITKNEYVAQNLIERDKTDLLQTAHREKEQKRCQRVHIIQGDPYRGTFKLDF